MIKLPGRLGRLMPVLVALYNVKVLLTWPVYGCCKSPPRLQAVIPASLSEEPGARNVQVVPWYIVGDWVRSSVGRIPLGFSLRVLLSASV